MRHEIQCSINAIGTLSNANTGSNAVCVFGHRNGEREQRNKGGEGEQQRQQSFCCVITPLFLKQSLQSIAPIIYHSCTKIFKRTNPLHKQIAKSSKLIRYVEEPQAV